ncbi:MAG: SMC-Scp complex subunit ScpB [Candidatus Omnitrophica bacterium]|nr:SMC-Scp complex subunit ScpB [Candidatus Omnitrophota bacterium]MBU4488470.1 SMC-Scp complex subunit ScpB [Candidatus Omnitrophota bacterium]MCG2705353.1 SMC-Scp complex subunit ScpB [Candidatus Omnitrophota bacterium]
MEQNELKKLLEAFLFVSSSPVQAARIKALFGVDEKAVETAFEELKTKYASDDTSLRVIKVAEGYRLSTSPEVAPYIRKFFKDQRPRLSRASLETLSVIAYKQPVTRSDVESIRGVNVEGPLGTLLERGLIRIAGRKDAPGRPILYGTTRLFLEHFGLNTLRDLPLLNEFKEEDLTEEEKAKAGRLREANNEPSQTS